MGKKKNVEMQHGRTAKAQKQAQKQHLVPKDFQEIRKLQLL